MLQKPTCSDPKPSNSLCGNQVCFFFQNNHSELAEHLHILLLEASGKSSKNVMSCSIISLKVYLFATHYIQNDFISYVCPLTSLPFWYSATGLALLFLISKTLSLNSAMTVASMSCTGKSQWLQLKSGLATVNLRGGRSPLFLIQLTLVR